MDLFTVYLICFGVGLLFSIVSVFLSHDLHGGHAGHFGDAHAADFGGGHDMPGFSPLSPTTIAAFITAFGGFGLILGKLEATQSPWVSAPLAGGGAFAVAAVLFVCFRAVFRSTQSSSESRVEELVGVSGTIITPIPPGGVGEIAYVHGGSRYTAPVRTEDGRAVASGATVYIVRVTPSQFYVMT